MADLEEPRPEVERFLSDRAGALDRDAAPIDAGEAEHRLVTHSLEPARWTHTPAAVAGSARRRPAVAAAVIAALLVGSLGGFAAGRSSAPRHASVAARGAAQDGSTAPSGFTTHAFATGGGGSMYPNAPTMTRLFLRTTSEGVGVRGYVQQMGMGPAELQGKCDPNSWCPPPECNPATYFMAELSNAEAVAQNGTPEFPLDGPAASRGETGFGQSEGAPVSSYMVQTNGDVTNVRGTWPDGFVDEMAPVNGWATVAHSGATAVSTLTAVLADGSSVELENAQGGYSYPAQCQPPPPPPPELPAAGTEQPVDVTAAMQAVTDAYQTVFTHGSDPAVNGTLMEDADNLKTTAEQVKKNFPVAADTVTVDVGEIRFLSSTEAALYFELKYQGGAVFGKQVGYAKLIDGTWKIARDTMCMVFGWGGGVCDPAPDPARSTSGGSAPPPEMGSASSASASAN